MFTRTLARTGARASLLAIVALATLAVSGLGASSASAAICKGEKIIGQGASLQKVAQQEIFIPEFEKEFCEKEKLEGPEVEYISTGSGPGLKAWGFTTEKVEAINYERQYIGTDDAPTEAQIKHARESAELTSKKAVNSVVVPVAQTAIAIVASLPKGCKVVAGKGINNADLEAIFSGKIVNWSEVANLEGTCSLTLERVVREEGSGTTFQFKNYLFQINKAAPCAGEKTWEELEPIGAGEKPNIDWPECEKGALKMAPLRGKGGSGVVTKVNEKEGRIGYAALPDAKAGKGVVLPVQNASNLGKPSGWALPENGELANCANSIYTVPAEARKSGKNHANVDWSKVFGGKPGIGGGNYPICTLTYDLAWDSYANAGFPAAKAEMTGKTAGNYLARLAKQNTTWIGTLKKFYAGLPTSAKEENNVQEAADLAAALIK